MEAAKDAHAICVLTEWDEFKQYDYQKVRLGLAVGWVVGLGWAAWTVGRKGWGCCFRCLPGCSPRAADATSRPLCSPPGHRRRCTTRW